MLHNGKNPQLIQKDFHKTLTNVKQYLKNTKEDAQINHNGEEYVCVYVQLYHSAVHQKLTLNCKSTIFQ